MSFILDALKKSETERQQQAAAEFSAVPSAPQRSEAPRWIWLLGALLLVNLAVLSVAMLRDEPTTAETAAERAPVAAAAVPARTESTTAQTPADSDEGFATRLSETPSPPRRRANPTTVPATTPITIETPPPETVAARTAAGPASNSAFEALPTLTEIRLNDGVDLPDMSLDIHVFAAAPENRFVFIDMQKHQEGSVLDTGPRLIEITTGGVILDYRGTRFILPRE